MVRKADARSRANSGTVNNIKPAGRGIDGLNKFPSREIQCRGEAHIGRNPWFHEAARSKYKGCE